MERHDPPPSAPKRGAEDKPSIPPSGRRILVLLQDRLPSLPPESWEAIRARLCLSPREFQVSLAVLAGLTEKGIAKALRISSATVHTHLERIFRKLEVRSQTALVARLFQSYLEVHDEAAQEVSANQPSAE